MDRFCVILPAAGSSTRFGGAREKKIYADLDGRAVWLRAVSPFLNREDVAQIMVVIASDDRELFERRYASHAEFMNIRVIEGGAERSDSIAKALAEVDPSCGFIAIHDAARPCLTQELVDAVFEAARIHGAAFLATPVADTIKQADEDKMTTGTIPRRNVYLAQTPQVFRRDWLMEAYAERDRLGAAVTDDTQLIEAAGHRCAIVDGAPFNLKITTKADLLLAGAILKSQPVRRSSGSSHPFMDEKEMG